MSKHTPGPWKVRKLNARSDWEIRGAGDTYTGSPHGMFIGGLMSEANARLMAEAPLMLEVLRELEDLGPPEAQEQTRAILARIDGVAA